MSSAGVFGHWHDNYLVKQIKRERRIDRQATREVVEETNARIRAMTKQAEEAFEEGDFENSQRLAREALIEKAAIEEFQASRLLHGY